MIPLKASTREKRGKGVRRRVVKSAAIPGNWQSFLRVHSNKVELFSFLSKMLVQSYQEEGKELVVTDGQDILSVPQQEDINQLAHVATKRQTPASWCTQFMMLNMATIRYRFEL